MRQQNYKITKNNYNEEYAILRLKRDNMQEYQKMRHEYDVAEIELMNAEI